MGQAQAPDLTLVIPVYNQGAFLAETLAALRNEFSGIRVQIILVDDGSTKDRHLIAAADLRESDRLISFEKNHGKGEAVKAGAMASEGGIIIYLDVDLSYSPEFIRQLYEAVNKGAPAAFGVRGLNAGSGFLRNSGSRFLRRMTRRWVLDREVDTQCGAKAFSNTLAKSVFPKLTIKRFAFDVEIYYLLGTMNVEALELPAESEARQASSVRMLKDGLRFLRDLRAIRKNIKSGYYEQS